MILNSTGRSDGFSSAARNLVWLVAVAVAGFAVATGTSAAPSTRVAIIVGPSNHPPGSHEVGAGARLLKHTLEHLGNVPGVKAAVCYGWPTNAAVLELADTVVFLGDTFPPQRLPEPEQKLAQLGALMRRGVGIVCLHFATGLEAGDVAEDGSHPLLEWMGGYFADKCRHHQSVARMVKTAIRPAAPDHPVCRGWGEFTIDDEPYYNNYFGPAGNQPASNVVALATAMLPPDAPRREIVAWGVQRADGGCGFAVVMPHYYRNWRHEELRRVILNGIIWTARREVPLEGVHSKPPDLAAFQPDGIEPQPWKDRPRTVPPPPPGEPVCGDYGP